MKIKILHIITGLGGGGAENMLLKLLKNTDVNVFESYVISLTKDQTLFSSISPHVIGIYTFDCKGGLNSFFRSLIGIASRIREIKPDIVQSWMFHSDLIGGVISKLLGVKHVLWNIRHTTGEEEKRSITLVIRILAFLSHFIPSLILINSSRAVSVYNNLGYNSDLFKVVPNGFDIDWYTPLLNKKNKKINKATFMIGMVARYHPQKDHRTFLLATRKLHDYFGEKVGFLLCGKGVKTSKEINKMITELDIIDYIQIYDEVDDVREIYHSLDLCTLTSSFGEGFPNVVGEAMSCGVPCVVTDIGDSCKIVGKTGGCVLPKDVDDLVTEWSRFVEMPNSDRSTLAVLARDRIVSLFSISSVVESYETIYLKLVR